MEVLLAAVLLVGCASTSHNSVSPINSTPTSPAANIPVLTTSGGPPEPAATPDGQAQQLLDFLGSTRKRDAGRIPPGTRLPSLAASIIMRRCRQRAPAVENRRAAISCDELHQKPTATVDYVERHRHRDGHQNQYHRIHHTRLRPVERSSGTTIEPGQLRRVRAFRLYDGHPSRHYHRSSGLPMPVDRCRRMSVENTTSPSVPIQRVSNRPHPNEVPPDDRSLHPPLVV